MYSRKYSVYVLVQKHLCTQKLFKESVRVTEIITPNWTICYRLPAIIALADGNVKFCSNAFTDIRTMHPLDHESPSAQPVEGWMQHQQMRLMPRLRQIARQRQPASARRRIIKTRRAEKDNTHAIWSPQQSATRQTDAGAFNVFGTVSSSNPDDVYLGRMVRGRSETRICDIMRAPMPF